jgi:tetratricopeptide (TPR) repeat protein
MEKAAEALDRSIKLAPGPLVWNDVAYILALGNLQLEKAQQYAESAVTEVATKLRNVELERMTLEDLANVSSLTSYWDTLGWVHFKKGNLDLAEKYLMAAWMIGRHSEVGDHLGQVSEKRGKKDEAIRWYSLAVVGHRPVPEARENLNRLAGKEKVEPLLSKSKEDIAQFRTIKLGPLLKDQKEKLEAEYYLVTVPGAERNAQVAEVKFIRGAEKLRPLAAALKDAKYPMIFPDERSTKLILRGTLTCQPKNGECVFVILNPEDVTTVD